MLVVEVDGGPVLDLPAWMLPDGAGEGMVYRARAGAAGAGWRIELEPDPAAAEEARAAAEETLRRLRERDPGGDIVL